MRCTGIDLTVEFEVLLRGGVLGIGPGMSGMGFIVP